jgi:hypothetical protein
VGGLPPLSKPVSCAPPLPHPLPSKVSTKIRKAYCPPKVVAGNPCLEYVKYIVMPWFGAFEVSPRDALARRL